MNEQSNRDKNEINNNTNSSEENNNNLNEISKMYDYLNIKIFITKDF